MFQAWYASDPWFNSHLLQLWWHWLCVIL